MKKHIYQLDFLKSVFIFLMILFHLVYIGDTYPYMKKVVYTFHMPAFLVLSGYLSGVDKSIKQFLVTLWWFFLPYSIMESGYVIAASVLPVREQVGELSVINVIRRILIEPAGPYWYLHTLMLCRMVHYFMDRLFRRKLDNLGLLIITALVFWGISHGAGLMAFSNSMFFLAGAAIRSFKLDFTTLFSSSVWSVIPFAVLCCYPENLGGFTLAGCAIVYFIISFLLWIYSFLPLTILKFSLFVGKNTLCLLLFSPVFTMLSRVYQPLFMFEPTGVCFAVVTIMLTVTGCFFITWCMDKLGISPWFFGQERMLKN